MKKHATRITGVQNTEIGKDIADAWLIVRPNLEHPKWDEVFREAGLYFSTIRGMEVVFGQQFEGKPISELDEQDYDDAIDSEISFDAVVLQIEREVHADFADSLDWRDMSVRTAVEKGLHAAYLLMRSSTEVGAVR